MCIEKATGLSWIADRADASLLVLLKTPCLLKI
jgi:hypothetical protein